VISVEELLEHVQEKISEIELLRETGELTQDEYKELLEDATDIEKIYSKLDLEDDKIIAQKIINGIKAVYGLLQ